MNIRNCAALAALTLAASTAANAAIITVNMSGVLTSGTDGGGFFGTTGADLTGATFNIAATFDDTLGLYEDISNTKTLAGGPHWNGYSSPGSMVLTINGIDYAISGNSTSVINGNSVTGNGFVEVADRYFNGNVITENVVDAQYNPGFGIDIHDGWNASCGTTSLCLVNFSLAQYDIVPVDGVRNVYYKTKGTYYVGDVVISPPGVPEPATWAMMITGFGMAGVALRRRRSIA